MGGFILGSSDFVKWVKETFLANRSKKREISQLTELKPNIRRRYYSQVQSIGKADSAQSQGEEADKAG